MFICRVCCLYVINLGLWGVWEVGWKILGGKGMKSWVFARKIRSWDFLGLPFERPWGAFERQGQGGKHGLWPFERPSWAFERQGQNQGAFERPFLAFERQGIFRPVLLFCNRFSFYAIYAVYMITCKTYWDICGECMGHMHVDSSYVSFHYECGTVF